MKVYELQVHCPDLVSQADARDAMAAMANSPGFGGATVDVATHMVLVTTASQDQGQDIQRCLTRAGFPPDEMRIVQDSHRPG